MAALRGRATQLGLATAFAVGLALRIAYAAAHRGPPRAGDDQWFHLIANRIADGRGFTLPFTAYGVAVIPTGPHAPPTAFHPPLYPLVLSAVSLLGGRSYAAHQVTGCVLGAASAVVIGLLARRLAGPRAGVLAALVAAVSLPLVADDAIGMSEPLYALLVAAVLLAALRLVERPGLRAAGLVGAGIGLAGLTRGEAPLLLAVVALPAAWAGGPGWWRRLAVCAVVAVAVIAPWTARNALALHRFVPVSTNGGTVLAGANTPTTYFGPMLGSWDFGALTFPHGQPRNEADADAQLTSRGLRYARDHADRVPVVAAARVLRTWELWHPRQQVNLAIAIAGHLPRWEWRAWLFYVATAVLGAAALVTLRRRIAHLWLLAAPLLLVTLTTAASYGGVRVRDAADLALAALSGIALDALWRWGRQRAASPPG